MFENDLHEVISAHVPHFWERYDGDLNSESQRDGNGYQKWENGDFQKYSGEFLQDSLHGKGKYTWLRPAQSYMYEGGFYANNFEGYASLVRTDGQYFEGLLKNNRRFGPGVVTYPDGRQDVGLWDGPKLSRLSCVVMPEWIPRLARSTSGKIKLFKFRKLVPVRPVETTDNAKEVLRELGANVEVLEKSDQLYNSSIRHPTSKLFNKKLHDEKYFGQIDCTIEVADPETLQASIDSVVNDDEAVREALQILLENVGMLKDLPEERRREVAMDKLEEMREDYRLHSNENFAHLLVETLLENTDDMARRSEEEKVLIFNKAMIRKFLRSPEIKNDFPTKRIEVTDLLAWNNESASVKMMKHIFLHRNMESAVSFRVEELLAGDRTEFNTCGDHEKICVLFLTNCSVGNGEIIDNILLNYDLHHNLCDARGNAGITFAAARDRWSIIKKLTNAGVNLDVLNDEGVTPLTLCLLRYLAIKNSVSNWESAFLTNTVVTPEEELQIKTEWRPHVSLPDLNVISVTTLYETYAELKRGLEKLNLLNKPNPFRIPESDDLSIDPLRDVYDEIKSIEIDTAFRNFQEPYVDVNGSETQTYVFKLPCTKTQKSPKKSISTTEEFIITNKLKIVFTTIKILLSCGADPNIGEAPMPALIISLFCGNEELLNLLLASSADPNVVTADENLSPLHVLATLPFSKGNVGMFRTLLEHNADPNCKANGYHWMEEKTKIIGKHVLAEEDLGKTPLHILCMRHDFNEDADDFLLETVKLLIDFKANVSEHYLGHTPFSLAVLSGNLRLIEFFLDTSTVDPNEKLGEGMGVALTVPILKRYANAIPLQTAVDVYDLLMRYYVNPLGDVDEAGNAVEFMYKEYEGEEKLETKRTSSMKKQSPPKSSKKKASSADDIKDYLLQCARKTLHRHIQYDAFKYLTYFVLEDSDLDDEVSDILVKLLSLADAERIIQILLRKRVFYPNEKTDHVILRILQRIKSAQTKSKKGKAREDDRTPEEVLNTLDFDTIDPVNKFGLIEPEVDPNKDRYRVCFNCGRKVGKILLACPNCGLVYFCSEECNKISIRKHSGLHTCGVLFYSREKKRQEECSALGLEHYVRSKLSEKLNEIKRGREGRGDGSDFNFERDFDLLDLKEGKFAGIFVPARKSDTPGSLRERDNKIISKLDKGSSHTKERGKGSVEVSLDEDAQRKQKGKRVWISEDDEGRKQKYRMVRSDDDDDEKGKVGAKKNVLGKREGKSTEETVKDGGTWTEKEDLSKHKVTGGVRTEKDASDKHKKSRKSVRDEMGEHTRSKRGKSEGKTKDRGAYSDKDEVGRKDKTKERGERTKNDALYKSGRKSKPKGNAWEKRTVRTKKIWKDKEEGAGRDLRKYDGRILGQKTSVKRDGKFGVSTKLGYLRGSKLEKGKLITEQFLYRATNRRGHESVYPKLSMKYQHYLEILGEFFPDFDLCMLLLPYACFVDGQLYYRFLDEKPLFCLTYSNL